MTQASFEAFRNRVLAEPVLQEELRDIPERAIFTERILALGQAHGYEFTADDVTNALQASRRAWIERWIR